MIDWLCGGRTGTIPDGATLILETHPIDSSLDISRDAQECMQINADVDPTSWAVAIRAHEGSRDAAQHDF